MARQTLSAVIPVYNVEPIISRCLDALTWADEVVVVDMFSTDRTEEICRSYPNVTFVQRRDYIFGNFNFGASIARGDWILKIDSDEVVSPELAEEIQRDVLERGENLEEAGFLIPSRVYFFGKRIRYGVALDPSTGGPPYAPKLFRKGTAYHECRSEHEPLTTTGRYGRLKHFYDHYSHPTVAGWIAKMNYYTDRDVERIDVTAPDFRLPKPGRTLAALVKIFFDYYVRRKGYRDGIHGFMVTALNTFYLLVFRCKVWEKHWHATHSSEVHTTEPQS